MKTICVHSGYEGHEAVPPPKKIFDILALKSSAFVRIESYFNAAYTVEQMSVDPAIFRLYPSIQPYFFKKISARTITTEANLLPFTFDVGYMRPHPSSTRYVSATTSKQRRIHCGCRGCRTPQNFRLGCLTPHNFGPPCDL